MGAKVKSPLNSSDPKIIDYAFNGMRSDFMDIYLGANCEFAITVGTGIDAVPMIFRRPIVQVNYAPLGYCYTWGEQTLLLVKHHIRDDHECTLSEIFTNGVGFCLRGSDYESKNVRLVENTPEEIRDIALEFIDRLEGNWYGHPDDEELQRLFWKIFPTNAVDVYQGMPLHGKIRARYSAKFLRENRAWLR
jgi:putative glycosyltransferase (TIGR04372 family)